MSLISCEMKSFEFFFFFSILGVLARDEMGVDVIP